MQRLWPFVPAVVVASVLACSAESGGASFAGVRDTLSGGVVVVRYPRLFQPRVVPLAADLSIGVVEGDPHYIFGDVRGIESDSAGNVYVLDFQASEIRKFDPRGRFLRTIARKGQGPGELTAANGMVLVGDSVLWVQDHGKWMLIALSLEGEELTRVPMHVRSYGYVWSGTIDDRGRIWKPTSHSDAPPVYPPKEGVNEGTARSYINSYDPRTKAIDSVYLGEQSYRTLIARNDRGGYTYRGVPFGPATIVVVDPAGGFWSASGTGYRVARLDERADTTLVIEVLTEPIPVTGEDRDHLVDQIVESSPDDRRAAEELAALMPSYKPAIAALGVDDAGRLWVRRTSRRGQPTTYDVFRRDGSHAFTVTLAFEPAQYFPLRVRHGRIYALVRDSLDVPRVVRTGPVGN